MYLYSYIYNIGDIWVLVLYEYTRVLSTSTVLATRSYGRDSVLVRTGIRRLYIGEYRYSYSTSTVLVQYEYCKLTSGPTVLSTSTVRNGGWLGDILYTVCPT